MAESISTIQCSQCGRGAPADGSELASWKHGDLVLRAELDDVTATMLLCPDCVEEDRTHAYDAGEPG